MGEHYKFGHRQTNTLRVKTTVQYVAGALCLAGFFAGILFLFSNIGDNEDLIAGNTEVATVPTYKIDFTGSADGVFVTPPIVRGGAICNAEGNERCVSFTVTLDANAEGIVLEQIAGELPKNKTLYYIDCDQPTPLGQAVCVHHTGKVNVTYCAEGIQTAAYRITSLPKVNISGDTAGRKNSELHYKIQGMIPSTIKWTSIYPGKVGSFNSMINSDLGMNAVSILTTEKSPDKILYKVSGTHINACGDAYTRVDTVTINLYPDLIINASPANAICAIGGEVKLNVDATGGRLPYTFIWKNANGAEISKQQIVKVNTPGIYSVEVRDALYPTSSATSSSIEILPSQNPLPSEIKVGNVAQSSVMLSWSGLQNIYRYQIRFRKIGDGNWEYHNVMAPKCFFTLQKLNPGVHYEYQLMTYASAKGSDSSGWSSYKEFTTLADCVEVEGLKARANSYEATCSWRNNPFALKQYVMVREQGTIEWKNTFAFGSDVNSVRVPNLSPGKNYEWCVKCVCKNSDEKYTLSRINIFSTMKASGIASR